MRVPGRPLGLEILEQDLRRQDRIETRVMFIMQFVCAAVGTVLSLYFIRWWVSA